jgi:hypothetical protein
MIKHPTKSNSKNSKKLDFLLFFFRLPVLTFVLKESIITVKNPKKICWFLLDFYWIVGLNFFGLLDVQSISNPKFRKS